MASSKTIDLTFSDEENSIPPASGLTFSSPAAQTKPAAITTKTASSSVVTATKAPPKKKVKPTKAYSLIWVCTHGKGRRSSWRQKDLKIVGVYSSKQAAEQAKEHVMTVNPAYGHGDICVGDTWEDEIDLVIREAPLHL